MYSYITFQICIIPIHIQVVYVSHIHLSFLAMPRELLKQMLVLFTLNEILRSEMGKNNRNGSGYHIYNL